MRRLVTAFAGSLLACGARSGLGIEGSNGVVGPTTDAAVDGSSLDAASDATTDAPFACLPSVPLPPPTTPPPLHETCLVGSGFETQWTLNDPAWCVVGRHVVPEYILRTNYTWGRHDGPLEVAYDVGALRRWSTTDATAPMTSTDEVISFLAAREFNARYAVDVIGTTTTLVAGEPPGVSIMQMLLVAEGTIDTRITAPSLRAMPTALFEGGRSRVLFLAFGAPIGEYRPPIVEAVDDCVSGTCAPFTVDTLDRFFIPNPTGMIADPNGNVFAVISRNSAFGGYTTVDAYGRNRIAPGACPTKGVEVRVEDDVLAADGARLFATTSPDEAGVTSYDYDAAPDGSFTFGARVEFISALPSAVRARVLNLFIDTARRLWVLDATGTWWVVARR